MGWVYGTCASLGPFTFHSNRSVSKVPTFWLLSDIYTCKCVKEDWTIKKIFYFYWMFLIMHQKLMKEISSLREKIRLCGRKKCSIIQMLFLRSIWQNWNNCICSVSTTYFSGRWYWCAHSHRFAVIKVVEEIHNSVNWRFSHGLWCIS